MPGAPAEPAGAQDAAAPDLQADAQAGAAPAAPAAQAQAGAAAGPGLLAGGAGVVAWLVSGRGEAGLRGQAGRLAGFAAGRPGLDAAAVARALAVSRSQLEDRAVVLGNSTEELT